MLTGARLGPYEIVAKLGAGGMGEVWRARDTRLGREVALKLLPPGLVDDPERRVRFEREARVLASLNHPHIATLHALEHLELSPPSGHGPRATGHDVERAPSALHVLVMELVEGEDLAQRISRGPVPSDEAIPIARQIADALEAAHERGIVHRDLKPANVKVRPDGTVKVLDFGLAKALEPASGEGGPGLAHSPTLTHAATQAGIILGTAAYMAPEQARGQSVDKRTDIWAFGVVLYEMLAGRSLFAAATVTDTLAGVVKGEIDLAGLPETAPPAIRRLLRRCLERDPRNRLRDIGDARIAIDEAIDEALAGPGRNDAEAAPGPAIAPGAARRARVLWLAALVTVSAAAALVGYLLNRGEVAREPQRLAITLAAEHELAIGGDSLLAFSPDGRELIFVGTTGGRRMLFRRALAGHAAAPIAGTEDGQAPFFSPDGRWLGYAAGGKLMKIASEGGRPFPLADSRGAGGATWLADGTIVFAPIYSEGLFRVSAQGGPTSRLTTPDRAGGELGHWWPQPLPGERRIVFTAFRTPVDTSRIGVLDLETREVRWVVDGGFFGRFLPTGHLLYARGQRLYALPFDPASAAAEGAAAPVLDDLLVEQIGGNAMVAVSSRGTLAYVTESLGNPPRDVVWLDRSGRAAPAIGERHRFLSVDLAPDDRRAALTIQGDSTDLWSTSFERGTLSRLTSGDKTEFGPVWSTTGSELLYVVDAPPFVLHRIDASTPDAGRPIWEEPASLDSTSPAASPDGRTIAYTLTEDQTGANLYARLLDGSSPPRAIRATRSEEGFATFSPDGRWIAYHSDETGRVEVYVEAFPGPGERFQITADGGREPIWAGNGELLFRRGDELRVAATRLGARFEFDAPRTLFTFPIASARHGGSRTFDITRDGERIIAITIPATARPRQIEIVADWTGELDRLAPRGGQR